METSRRAAGATLIELMVGVGLLSLILVGLMLALRSAQTTTETGARMSDNSEEAARAAQRLETDIEETGIEFVDTGFRVHDSGNPAGDSLENHFHDAVPGLVQCTSPSCLWHTIPGTAERRDRVLVCRNYRWLPSGESVLASGRAWLGLRSPLCPLDSNFATSGADLDAMMLFTARTPAGDFVTSEASALETQLGLEGRPDWQGLVFYFPWYDSVTQDLQLRRLALHRADLLAGTGSQSGWTAWDGNSPAGVPTLIDLLDFGTDGTVDGVPDGRIPLTPTTSDAAIDGFYASGSYLIRQKYIQTPSVTRYFQIYLDRGTGTVQWFAYFYQSPGPFWYRSASFTRAPEVVVRHLIDVDFSTAVSNPFSQTNAYGVASPETVRVSVVLDRRLAVNGEYRSVEHVLDFEVQPRNSEPPQE